MLMAAFGIEITGFFSSSTRNYSSFFRILVELISLRTPFFIRLTTAKSEREIGELSFHKVIPVGQHTVKWRMSL